MKATWRFYRCADNSWRWEKLSADKQVVDESPQSYPDYESCVAAAKESGYVFEAAQNRIVRPGNDRLRANR